MMFRLAQHVVLSSGWTRRAIAVLAGACGALAMAPLDIFPALAVPITVAVWLIDGCAYAETGGALSGRSVLASLRAAADAGWWWGFGYGVAGLWWLGSAFLVEPDKFAWLLPFGVFGLPAYLALYSAFGFALARLLWSAGPARLLVLAASLTLSEWLRGTLLTGFPWNEFGMALGDIVVLAQAASVIGLHGLTLIAILLAAAPATLADRVGARVWRLAPLGGALVVLGLLAGFGALRLGQAGPGSVAGVRLRIMQPNAAADADFTYAHKDAILQHYLTLSDRATSPTTTGLADVTHLVWPESAFPFILSRDAAALATIAASLPATTTLITGAARVEPGPPDSTGRTTALYYNAIQVVADGGSIVDSYDKVHLVPFGEFLPLESVFHAFGIQHFVHIPGGFQSGVGRRLLSVPGLPPVAGIVCYEAIFSGDVIPDGARTAGTRPGLLLNVTNDSWFGHTAGPYQHFAQARLRAIEEGLPLVRAATTGISAIVDAHGRTVASLPIGVEGVLDGSLPGIIEPPLFGRLGNVVPLGLLLLCWLSVGIAAAFRNVMR